MNRMSEGEDGKKDYILSEDIKEMLEAERSFLEATKDCTFILKALDRFQN